MSKGKDEYKDKGEIIVLSSDSSDDDRKGPSKASVPIFEEPSVQGLLDYYGYNDFEEYLSWNYFPSTDKENTDKDITDKDATDEDCIHECNYAMSKGKYVPVSHKHNPKVKSHVPVIGCVLGLANVTTWEEIMNKIGVRKWEKKAVIGKLIMFLLKIKVLWGSLICLHFYLKFAACFCICKKTFASKHLHPAYAASLCKQAFAACICSLHLQASIYKQAFTSKHLQLAFAS
ncbi:hypothetical protein Tco_0487400 [Tanacetum coccineum]